MARIIECDAECENPCPEIGLIDEWCCRSLTTNRINQVENGEIRPWEKPVFADFVMVRDFLEESMVESGFRMVYPQEKNVQEFRAYFDRMKYHDIVFQEWMKLDSKKRLEVITTNWKKYERKMERIRQR
jgi:hypothetical protein